MRNGCSFCGKFAFAVVVQMDIQVRYVELNHQAVCEDIFKKVWATEKAQIMQILFRQYKYS